MVHLAELLQFAARQHRAGNWDEAERAYRQALAQAPHEVAIHRDLAWLLFARGNHQAAVDEMRLAIAATPGLAPLHNDLGMMFRQAGRVDDAVASFQQAIRLDPAIWQAQFNLGNAHQHREQFELAASCYEAALVQAPNDPDVHLNLGLVQKEMGQLAAARQSLERAMQIRPQHADAWINLGIVCKAEGNLAGAIDCWRRALEINPQSALAYNNLGLAAVACNDLTPAIDSFQQAILIDPLYGVAHANLGSAYESQGKTAQARACFEESLRLTGNDAIAIRRALALPVILASHEQIDETRRRLNGELVSLAGNTLRASDPVADIGAPAFALAYHGCNEREFQGRIAALLRAATPWLDFTALHCAKPAGRRGGQRIKIGFISSHFYNHTIGKLNAGLLGQLNREQFQVVVFRTSEKDDALAKFITDSAETCVTLPLRLQAAQAQIAQHQLDVLFYTDIGMDATTYYLAHARLAPVQCVTWGHPLTTGIPTIDYFISSQDLEPPDSEAHYSEKLVRLPHLANYYFRPQGSTSTKTREDFGLPQGNVYACLQSLFKLHPDDDRVLAQILRRDPRGRLVILEGNFQHWTELLRSRFERSMPDVCQRISFLKHQAPPDFSRLLTAVDVLLDPLHFGGGDTSYQAFAVGAPVVTLPSGFLRGRITSALYRTMGIDDLIASDQDDYVDRAVRLANDREWREQVRAKFLAANHKIFENPAGVRELEAFLGEAVMRTAGE